MNAAHALSMLRILELGRIRERKLGHVSAAVVGTAEPVHHRQIQNGVRFSNDPDPRVAHPAVLLAESCRVERAGARRPSFP